jgi:uncharacterized membrane protein YoaK (UPF0700 family)
VEADDMTLSGDHLAACRLRDAAALTLAVTSGATDAISFLALGGAFTSVMTGNLVLLGVSLGYTDSGLSRQIGAAVVGYIAGCAIGARITGTPVHGEPVWPTAVTRGLAVEAVLFVMYAAGWWAVGGRPGGAAEAGLLGLSALALGIQSASVRRFGVTGLSTTYLTGTLTTLVIRLASGGRFRNVARNLLLLLALLAGAAVAAALLALHAFALVPLVQLIPLGMVVVVALAAVARQSGAQRRGVRGGSVEEKN